MKLEEFNDVRTLLLAFILGLLPALGLAGPKIAVIYMTEPRVSRLNELLEFLSPRCALAADSAIDEAGNRFNCKNAYWYDLTCNGQPAERAPASADAALVLLDVSQSMRGYDPVKGGTCHRARLLRALKRAGAKARVFEHAETLGAEIPYKQLSDSDIDARACKAVGDNQTRRVFERALAMQGASQKPVVMITDVSEQKPELAAFLRSSGGREVFSKPEELAMRVLQLLE